MSNYHALPIKHNKLSNVIINHFEVYTPRYSEISGTKAIVEATPVKTFANWMRRGLSFLIE